MLEAAFFSRFCLNKKRKKEEERKKKFGRTGIQTPAI